MLWVGRDVAMQRLYRRYYFEKLSYPNRIGRQRIIFLVPSPQSPIPNFQPTPNPRYKNQLFSVFCRIYLCDNRVIIHLIPCF